MSSLNASVQGQPWTPARHVVTARRPIDARASREQAGEVKPVNEARSMKPFDTLP